MTFDLNNFTTGKSKKALSLKRKKVHLTEVVRMYLSPAEKEKLQNLADEEGLKLSVWLRLLLKRDGYFK